MFQFWKSGNGAPIKKVAERQLRMNEDVIKSLRDHDEGKKTISTSNIERRLPSVRVTP